MKISLRLSVAIPLALFSLLLGGCPGDTPGEVTGSCTENEAMCFEHPEYILECTEEGVWSARQCEEGLLCYQGECQELICVPGSRSCEGDSVIGCRDDGQGLLYPEPCPEEDACFMGDCLPRICEDGEMRCVDDVTIERCENNGTFWVVLRTCQSGTTCVGEICLPDDCDEGETECGPTVLYTCDASGDWVGQDCPDDQPCVFGRCVECVGHHSCGEGRVCEEGQCVETSPTLTSLSLPAGTVGLAYDTIIEAEGGLTPYDWEIVAGDLPDGIGLAADGWLQGTPTAAGTGVFTLRITDANDRFDEREYSIEIVPAGGALRIMTTSLTEAMHGLPYQFSLQAAGGQTPYAWQLLEGPLPTGIELGSSGRLSGIPDEIGTFPLTLRVFDGLTPPAYASAELSLTVQIAPLAIFGDTEYDLLLTKVIVLPMLIPYIPYSEQLQARGGLRPYTWNEDPPPSGLDWIIPEWGLPSGLTLNANGLVSGWVTDVSDATTVNIPFTNISMTGYFFHARVTDSQDPTESVTAVFCLPTVPL